MQGRKKKVAAYAYFLHLSVSVKSGLLALLVTNCVLAQVKLDKHRTSQLFDNATSKNIKIQVGCEIRFKALKVFHFSFFPFNLTFY